jgi:tRNA nucleotidyltransferase (CCA-adding enzyme)
MKIQFEKLPKNILEIIYRVRDISTELNMPAFLVGGFVRDLALSVKKYDLDIAVEGQGIEFARHFCRGLDGRLVAHSRFGTATVYLGNINIDFASTRRETYPQPAALPVVRPSPIQDDLFRRDFTINTLAISLSVRNFGALLDLFKGTDDLRKGIIRVLHDQSFIDDPTRIVRAVRFEQRFGFRIEPHTLRLLKGAVRERMLLSVQPQRLRDELFLMVREETPEKAVIRLGKLAGWDFLSPRITPGIRRVARLFPRIRSEAAWFRQHNPSLPPADIEIMCLAALFSGLSRDAALSAGRKFCFGRKEISTIVSYITSRKRIASVLSRNKVMPSSLFNLLDSLPYEAILLVKAESRSRGVKRRIADFFSSCHGMRVSISGYDVQRLGIPPGPAYQRIFRSLLEGKLNGKLKTRDDELEFVRRRRKGLS